MYRPSYWAEQTEEMAFARCMVLTIVQCTAQHLESPSSLRDNVTDVPKHGGRVAPDGSVMSEYPSSPFFTSVALVPADRHS